MSADTDGTAASPATVAADLRRVARTLGHPPRTREYTARGRWGPRTVCRHLEDSWDDSLAAAGLDPDAKPNDSGWETRPPGAGVATYTDAELLDWLIAWYETFGVWPTTDDARDSDSPLPAARTYHVRFGTFVAARDGAKARYAKHGGEL